MISNNIAIAKSNFIRLSPTKLNKILEKIRGKKYLEVLRILKYIPQRAGKIVWKTVYSAVSNGGIKFNFQKENIIISTAQVTKGSILKRLRPRARGKSFPIQKKLSHLTIKVKEL